MYRMHCRDSITVLRDQILKASSEQIGAEHIQGITTTHPLNADICREAYKAVEKKENVSAHD